MDENTYLSALETAHRENTGSFCYVATHFEHDINLWRMSIVERNVSGHYPVSEDYFLGSKIEADRLASRLNEQRLNLSPREAAIIIMSSMTGAVDDRRRSL